MGDTEQEDVNITDADKMEESEETSEGGLTSVQKEALKQAFCDIDIDGSGTINKKELRTALQLIGQNPTDEEIHGYMEGSAEEGVFTEEEFFDFVEKHVELKSETQIEQELKDAFLKFDENNDGEISREEFIKIMTQKGDEPLTEEEAGQLMEKLDKEKDEKLSMEELRKLFTGNI